jgi:glycopeptide antibiotics resistance protein
MKYYQSTATNTTKLKYLIFVLFIIYVLLLSKYILFTRMHTDPVNYFSLKHIQASIVKGVRRANLQPFKTIKLMLHSRYISTDVEYKNLGGNLFGFLPLGIFLPLLFKRFRSFLTVTAVVFAISLSYELIQLCTGLGVFDVDDLILNTAGGLIGYVMWVVALNLSFRLNSETGLK